MNSIQSSLKSTPCSRSPQARSYAAAKSSSVQLHHRSSELLPHNMGFTLSSADPTWRRTRPLQTPEWPSIVSLCPGSGWDRVDFPPSSCCFGFSTIRMLITLMVLVVAEKSRTFSSVPCSADEQVCRSWEGALPGSLT